MPLVASHSHGTASTKEKREPGPRGKKKVSKKKREPDPSRILSRQRPAKQPALSPSGLRLRLHDARSNLLLADTLFHPPPPTKAKTQSHTPTPHSAHGGARLGEAGRLGLAPCPSFPTMATPTVSAAAAALLHPAATASSFPTASARRVGPSIGPGNGSNASAVARRGAVRARVAAAPASAVEGCRQDSSAPPAAAAPAVEIPVTCYQASSFGPAALAVVFWLRIRILRKCGRRCVGARSVFPLARSSPLSS